MEQQEAVSPMENTDAGQQDALDLSTVARQQNVPDLSSIAPPRLPGEFIEQGESQTEREMVMEDLEFPRSVPTRRGLRAAPDLSPEKAAEIVSLAETTKLPLSYVHDNLAKIKEDVMHVDPFSDPDRRLEASMMFGLVPLMYGLGPVQTLLPIGIYEGIKKAASVFQHGPDDLIKLPINLEVYQKEVPDEATRRAVQAMDFIAGGVLTHQFYKTAAPIVDKALHQFWWEYQAPKTVVLSPGMIRETMQAAPEFKAEILNTVGLTEAELANRADLGLTVQVPAMGLLKKADRPWFAALKKAVGLEPMEKTAAAPVTAEKTIPGAAEPPTTPKPFQPYPPRQLPGGMPMPEPDVGGFVSTPIGKVVVKSHPEIMWRVAMANADMLRETGKGLQVTSSFRTYEEQDALYQRYLRGEGGIAAPPGQSRHESGEAIDVANWKEAQPFLARYGLVNPIAGDAVHFQSKDGRIASASGSEVDRIKQAIANIETRGSRDPYTQPNLEGSGAYGKYQFMPATWEHWSSRYSKSIGGPQTPLAQTAANQEAVTTYKIATLLSQGKTPAQIAKIWNHSDEYVAKVMGEYEKVGPSTVRLPSSVEELHAPRGTSASVIGLEKAPTWFAEHQDPYVPDRLSSTETPEFNDWFGGSKVVDESGKPRVMYHGTRADVIEVFDKSKIREMDYDTHFNGFWFSSDKETSPAMQDAKKVIPVYLSINNPAPPDVWREVAGQVYREFNSPVGEKALRSGARSVHDEVRLRLQDAGYDGVKYAGPPEVNEKELETKGVTSFTDSAGRWFTLAKNEEWPGGLDLYEGKGTDHHVTGYEDLKDFLDSESEEHWVAFEPTQIKSINNRGAWSKTDPHIFKEAQRDLITESARTRKRLEKAGQLRLWGGAEPSRGLVAAGGNLGAGEGRRPDEMAPRTVYKAFKDLETEGVIDLRGLTCSTPEDLATLAQGWRNPQYETIRYIYIRDGKIIDHEGVTTRLPGRTRAYAQDTFEDAVEHIRDRLEALGADEIYMLHNHPSGNPLPSQADMSATLRFSDVIPEMKGHVVINSGKYSVIDTVGLYEIYDLPGLPDDWVDPILGEQTDKLWVRASKDVAAVAKRMAIDPDAPTLVYLSAHLSVQGVQQIKLSTLDDLMWLPEKLVDFGATGAALYIPKSINYPAGGWGFLVQKGYFVDVLHEGQHSMKFPGQPPALVTHFGGQLYSDLMGRTEVVSNVLQMWAEAIASPDQMRSVGKGAGGDSALDRPLRGSSTVDVLEERVKTPYNIAVRENLSEVRTYEVSLPPEIASKFPDLPSEITLETLEQARAANAAPERVKDYAEIYAAAKKYTSYAAGSKALATSGKLKGVEVMGLTKGCQRAQTTIERVYSGLLPHETRVEACYGATCWANRQWNRFMSTHTNIDVRDLQLTTPKAISKWFKNRDLLERWGKAVFLRQGALGCDSHSIASGLAEHWLSEIRKSGITTKTVFISAGYAPVTDAQYAALAKYADLFELHISISGWFHRNELMLRLGEYDAARRAGLPAVMRLITNVDKIAGIEMPNDEWLANKLKEMGVPQEHILETPYHDDALRGKKGVQDRSEPTGEWKYVCCETGKCHSCGVKCMSAVPKNASFDDVSDAASVETSYKLTGKLQRKKVDVVAEEQSTWGDVPEDYDAMMKRAYKKAWNRSQIKVEAKETKLRRAWTKEALEVYQEDPLVQTMTDIVKRGGISRELFEQDFDSDSVTEINAIRPRLITNTGKLSPDIAAAEHGFDTADELIEALKGVRSREQYVADYLEHKKAEYEADAEYRDADFTVDLLDEEIKAISEENPSATAKMQNITDKEIKRFILVNTGQKKLGDLVTEDEALRASMKKAERAARRAYTQGKMDEALALKDKMRTIAKIRRAEAQRKVEIQGMLKDLEKAPKVNNLEKNFKEQIRKILAGYGLGTKDRGFGTARAAEQAKGAAADLIDRLDSEAKGNLPLEAFLKELIDEGEIILDPNSILALPGNKPYKDLTYPELVDLHAAIKNLLKVAKNYNTYLTKKGKADFTAHVVDLITEALTRAKKLDDTIQRDPLDRVTEQKGRVQKALESWADWKKEAIKPVEFFRLMDGYEKLGPWQKAFYRPMWEAENAELELKQKVADHFGEVMDKIEWDKTVLIPELENRSLTREQLVAMVLNTGNEGNRVCLIHGFGIDEADIDTLRDHLTDVEKEFVDLFHRAFDEITWPYLDEVTFEVTGERLEKVAGKYYPIIPDSKLNWRQEKFAAEDDEMRFFKDIYNRPSVKTRGSHKRTGYKGPVVLSVLAGLRELHSQIHFVTHRIPVRNALKTLGDHRIRAAVTMVLGDAAYKQLIPWVANIAKPDKPPQTRTEKILANRRRAITDFILLFRVSTLVNQPFAILNAMADSELGMKAVLRGSAAFWADRSHWNEYMKTNSQWIAHRAGLFDKSIADLEREISLSTSHPLKDIPEHIRNAGYGMIGFMDAIATKPAWVSAHLVGLEQTGWDEALANEYADQVTARTQGSGSPKDVPLMQQGNEFWKSTFGMLFTFASSMTSQFWGEWQKYKFGASSLMDLVKAYFYMFLMGGVINYTISKRKPPTTPWEGLKAVSMYQLGGYPFLREIVGVLEGREVRGAASLAAISKQIGNLGIATAKGKPQEAAVAALGIAGAWWGFPPDQAIMALEGIIEMQKGKSGPERMMFRGK